MKRALIGTVVLAALVAVPAALLAQAKADLSGSWTMDEAKSDPPPARGGGGGGGGGRGGGRFGGPPPSMTIKQTATDLTITRPAGPNGDVTLTYKLDGSETSNQMGRGGEAKSKVSWEGSKLVISTTQTGAGPNGDMTVTSKDVYSLEGGVLTLETTRSFNGNAQTRKAVYNKS